MTSYLRAPGNWCGVVNLSSRSTRKLVRGDVNQIERTRLAFLKKQISDHRYLEKVFQNLRQKLNLAEEAPILDLKTNALIWGLLISTTMKAADHLGPNYKENLVVCKNTNFEELKNLFDITQRMILEDDAEILNISTIVWKASSWTSCDIFPVHLCHVLLCRHCICVHFRRALGSQSKRCFPHLSSHRVAPIVHCAHSPHW